MQIADHIIYPFNEEKSLRSAYGDTLALLGKKNTRIVVLDADLSISTKTSIFAKQFPDRHFDMGIAEADMIGTAAGMAISGLIPFASSFAMFAVGRTYDQIRNAIAYADIPVRIVATHSGLTVGEDGGSHQMLEDVAMMRVLPNMSVIVPADAHETTQVINYIAKHQHPIYVKLTRAEFPVIYNEKYKYQFGKWDILCEGDGEIVIFACGLMVSRSLEAAIELKKHNIKATLINASTIKPIDEKTIDNAIKNAKLIVTAEEALIAGGLGGVIAEYLSENSPKNLLRIGVNDKFGQSGSSDDLLEFYELTTNHIVKKILKKINKA